MASAPIASEVSVARYAIGVAITVFAILSQYFVPELFPATLAIYGNLAGDLFIVYGIPVLTFALLVGAAPLRNWKGRMELATIEGLGWYGVLSLLALVVLIVLVIVYEIVDPSVLPLLNRPNPDLTAAKSNPWFWVGFSFVVGAFEETIFRGWIFGFWRNRSATWIAPAFWTSALFAGVHLYYGETYGPVAPLIFPSLFLAGFAFAATYQASGGNLVIVALLHGANDATAFLTLVNSDAGLAAHYLLILAGAIVGLVWFVGEKRERMFAPHWARPELDAPPERPDPVQFPSGPP